jgi:hypothetical protein
VWLPEPLHEITLSPEQYDFSLSLLLLGDPAGAALDEEQELEDTYERFVRHGDRRRE